MAARCDDMHQIGEGVLRVFRDRDGDAHIAITSIDQTYDRMYSLSVEFVMGSAGGRSPKTFQKLLELIGAIEEDNQTFPALAAK